MALTLKKVELRIPFFSTVSNVIEWREFASCYMEDDSVPCDNLQSILMDWRDKVLQNLALRHAPDLDRQMHYPYQTEEGFYFLDRIAYVEYEVVTAPQSLDMYFSSSHYAKYGMGCFLIGSHDDQPWLPINSDWGKLYCEQVNRTYFHLLPMPGVIINLTLVPYYYTPVFQYKTGVDWVDFNYSTEIL